MPPIQYYAARKPVARLRAHHKMKRTFYLLILSVAVLMILLRTIARDAISRRVDKFFNQNLLNNDEVNIDRAVHEKETSGLKYILQWTNPKNVPFVYMGVGQQGFIERNCSYTNCFVTSDREYLGDYTKFDVIAFAGPEVVRMLAPNLPQKRSPTQKFVFTNIESSHYYPVCSNKFDGFFNWTWTFRLDSESRWGYIIIRNAQNEIIGPNKIMHWIKFEDMDPVSTEIKEQLKSKTKAAAWFVSNCFSKSRRETFAKELSTHLKKYNLTVDIYGKCGTLSCPRDNQNACDEMIKRDYYFYLSFENSFSEDYVTEKLLYGLKNYAVPIVFGGANYTRYVFFLIMILSS